MDEHPATAVTQAGTTMPSPIGGTAATAGPGASGVVGMIGSLAVVLALIFAMAWLARRLQSLRRNGAGLQLLAGLPVGNKEKVVLLKVGEEHFLVGVASGQVSLLHRFDAAPDLGDAEPALAQAPFAIKLRELLQRGGK